MLDRIRRSTTLQRMARSIHPANVKRAVLDRAFPYTFTSCEKAFGDRFLRGTPFCESQRVNSPPPEPAGNSTTLDIPQRRCLFLQDGHVWPAHAMATGRHGLVPIESGFDLSRMESIRRSGTLSHYPILESRSDAVVAIECGVWWMNYYHAMIEALPRVWALHFGECRDIASIEVLVSRLTSPGWRAMLEAMLPANARVRAVPVESLVRCGTVIVSPCLPVFEAGFLPPAYVEFFRATMSALHGFPRFRSSTRIYVSRSRALMRRVANEDEVMKMLETRGFQFIHLEDMSFADQYAIFSRAEVVVAPHGAGLTNIIYSPPGCVVLDVFPSEPVPYYRWLALSCGHRYAWMRGDRRDKNVASFPLEIEALARKLDEIGG